VSSTKATPAGGHQQAEPGLADLGQRVLLGGGLGAQRVVAVAVALPRALQLIELVADLGGVLAEEAHEQQRLGVALQALRQAAELQLGARQVEDRAVDHLDRRRLQRECVLGRGDRGVDGLEVTHGERGRLRQLDQPDGRGGDHGERALGAGDQLRQVERLHAVQPVAAGLAPVARVVVGDGARVLAQDLRHDAIERALQRVGAGAAVALDLVDGSQAGARAVGQHHFELEHVVDRRAVDDRLAARGVVGDHAAERRPVRGRGVRAEPETEALGRPVEVLLDDAGLDAHSPRAGVDRPDGGHVARGVEHQAAPADRLPGEAGAGAAGDDRNAEAGGDRDGRGDVVGVARERDRERLDGEDARVGSEQMPAVLVGADIAGQLPLQRGRELPRGHLRLLPARYRVKRLVHRPRRHFLQILSGWRAVFSSSGPA
jgi:hypothetical protein